MKQPSIPLEMAYKVVVVGPDGRMWSSNNTYRSHWGDNHDPMVIQYKLRHVVKPNTDVPVLFVCPTKEEGLVALKFYQDDDVKTYLLRGYVGGLKEVTDETIDNEVVARGGNKDEFWFAVPIKFTSCVCDFFIPIGIVAKQGPLD